MKQLTLILITCLIVSYTSGQNWNHRLYAVQSNDSLEAWVVGSNGTILHTLNGGLNWIDKSVNSSSDFYVISFSDSLNGFVAGGAMLFRTTDGGENWFNTGFPLPVKTIQFVDESNGWMGVSGYPPQGFYRTINGGDDWTFIEKPLLDISFVNPLCGWGAVYDSCYLHTIEKTEDGGISWTPIYTIDPFSGAWEFHLWFLDTLNGVYSDKGLQGWGYNLKTTNGGNNWQNTGGSLDGQIRNMSFIDKSNIWMATSDSHIWYSNNFLQSSSSFELIPNNDYVMDISVNGYSNGWAVGWSDFDKGSIWKLENINDWNRIDVIVGDGEITNISQEFAVFPNPFHHEMNLRYRQKEIGMVNITVYNIRGGVIETLIKEKKGIQDYHMVWDSKAIPVGVYLIFFKTSNGTSCRKIIKQ